MTYGDIKVWNEIGNSGFIWTLEVDFGKGFEIYNSGYANDRVASFNDCNKSIKRLLNELGEIN